LPAGGYPLKDWELAQRKLTTLGEKYGLLDHVTKLADVSRKRIARQRGDHLRM
jgi:hypothetical protein